MAVTLQQLEFFRAVARNLSFSNAAKELYTSQPYVSNQIRKLEDHFGVPLFIRSYPQISFTEAGKALYGRIEQVLDDVLELEQVVKQFRGLHRGTVELAATESAGNHRMPEVIAAFQQDYPDIIVHMQVGNTESVTQWLDLDEVEIGILPQKPDSTNLTAEPFYREPLAVICHADMDLADPLPVAQFARLPKVIREGGSLTLAKMNELLEGYPSGQDYVAQMQGTTAVNEAVAAGVGVTLAPARSAKAWLQAGAVRVCELDGVSIYHEFYVVYSQQRYLSPAAHAFIKCLHEVEFTEV